MKKIFTLIAAVLFAGSVSAENVSIWKNDGTLGEVSWDSQYRFALAGTDTESEACCEFSQDVWEKIKTQPIHITIQGGDWPQVRVTTGWWSVNFLPNDVTIESGLLVNNGDGTYGLTINLADNPELVNFLDSQHLLFTGGGYTLEELFLVEEGEGGDTPSTGGDEVDIPLSVGSWGWGFNSETTMEGDLLVGTLTGDYGAISTGFDPEVDWSDYEKLCVVIESYSNDWGKVFIKDKAETYMPEVSFGNITSQTTVSLELDSEKATNIYQIAIQGKAKDDVIKVSRVYLVKRATTDDPGTDGINTVKAEVENGAIYNIAGQKVNENYKGLVIKNGKKYIQK